MGHAWDLEPKLSPGRSVRCLWRTGKQALGVCLGLHAAKNATVRTAADMTVRQIISLLFDRVAEELVASADHPVAGTHDGQPNGSLVKGARSEGGGGGGGGGGAAGRRAAESGLTCARVVFQVSSSPPCRG